jgi:predicted negative regulator of RcsB-dependent stress response
LALAYSGLGDNGGAIRNFEAAMLKNRSDLLLIAAAKAYVDANAGVKAEALLLEVLANGKDDLAKENGRFMLGEIYKARGDNAKAEEQYAPDP